PKFSTMLAEHVSGRESRGLRYTTCYRDVELTYEVLRSAAAYEELQTIAGFFEAVDGGVVAFWFAPPHPNLAANAGQVIGTGDGATTTFPLVQTVGSYSEAVEGTSGVSAVYLDSVSASGWSVTTGYAPAIVFASAPGAGVSISADFGLLWLCRFAD